MNINEQIFYFFYGLFNHQSALLSGLIIFFADTLPYLIIGSLGFFYYIIYDPDNGLLQEIKKYSHETALIFLSVLTASGLAHALKMFFSTQRPFNALPDVVALLPETGFAFPSAHSAFFAALAFSVFYFHRKTGYLLILLTVLIGIARIMAGVHFPVDILGGFLVGIGSVYAVKYILKKFAYFDKGV